MTDKHFTLDSDHMESLIYAIRNNAERESQGFLRFVFAEKIERVSEDIPSEAKDEFFLSQPNMVISPLLGKSKPWKLQTKDK